MKKNTFPKIAKKIAQPPATIEQSSPFKNVTSAFNLLNREFPSYHSHMHWELIVILQGEIVHTINDMDFVCKKGDACLIRPSDKHCLNYSNNLKFSCQYVTFSFRNSFAESLFNLHSNYEMLLNSSEILRFSLDDSDITVISDKCSLTHNLSQEDYEANTKLIISQILLKFFEQRLLFDANYPTWFNNFLTYISTPSNFGQTVEELSNNTSYSYSRLARLFKKYTGITMIDYINKHKMIYAKRLLRTTNLTTLQICEKLGHISLSSFNHLFKKAFDITPSEYRKEHTS